MTVDSVSYENAYTSAVEVFGMWSNPPEHLFTYPKVADGRAVAVSTWTGEPLSRAGSFSCGAKWRDNFGGERQAVSFQGLSGHWYHGTRFMGSGDYIRAKRCKL